MWALGKNGRFGPRTGTHSKKLLLQKNGALQKDSCYGFGNLSWGYDSFWVGEKVAFEPPCTQNSGKDDLVSSQHRLRWTECELRSKVGHLHASHGASTCPWCSFPKTKALAGKAPYLRCCSTHLYQTCILPVWGLQVRPIPPKMKCQPPKFAINWRFSGWPSEVLASLCGWTRKVSLPRLPSRKSFQIWDQINIANKNDIRDSNYRF